MDLQLMEKQRIHPYFRDNHMSNRSEDPQKGKHKTRGDILK